MAKVIGRDELCRIDDIKKYALQVIEGKTLFDRYKLAEANIINRNIDAEYQHFLAYPVQDGNTITFHGKKYDKPPRLLSELQGDDLVKYTNIKEETLAHFNNKINSLRDSGKTTEAQFLANAVKYIDNRFVYCYDDDDKVVLGCWGMRPRNVREDIGAICKNLVRGKKKPFIVDEPSVAEPEPEQKSWQEPEQNIRQELEPEKTQEAPPADLFTARFDTGENDSLTDDSETAKPVVPPIDILEDKPKRRRLRSWLKWLFLLLLLLLLLLGWLLWDNRLKIEDGVVTNRLNIFMEDEDKSIEDLKRDFKKKYPQSRYKVVDYSEFGKLMWIKVPSKERDVLKKEIREVLSQEYKLLVFDEIVQKSKYEPDDPDFKDPDKSWYLHAVNAPQAWDITRGSQKHTIAIVDDGFSLNHPELKDKKIVKPYNVWLKSNRIFPQKIDHGTHVAGTALAIANNGKGLSGIAPECAFMPVQVGARRGVITTMSTLYGVFYALNQGADVINISLGPDLSRFAALPEKSQRDSIDTSFKAEEEVWKKIMNIAERKNAVIVVAAGNDNVLAGIDAKQRPENIITVSATDKQSQASQNQKANFSNYGKKSTVSAPGVGIYSCVGSNEYKEMDGTSMAAPIVTGGVALIKSLNESLTAKQIICILKSTGLPTGGNIGNLIQLDKALEMVKSGEAGNCVDSSLSLLSPSPSPFPSPSPCNTEVKAGGDEGYTGSFQMGQKSGSFVFHYNTLNIPDRITIHNGSGTGGKVIFKYEGSTMVLRDTVVEFNEPTVTVEVISLGNGTVWNFMINCPTGANPRYSGGNNPPSKKRQDELQRELERLQREINEIKRELMGTGNNVNSKDGDI